MNKKIKVVIADDIKVIAETNKNIALKNDNIAVVGIAYNGKQELEMILNLKPDLVITDNKMPEMNGIEVIKNVRNLKLENKPEFILVTGDNGYELNKQCNELGVFKVLGKIGIENTLLYAIDEYVSLKNSLFRDVKKTKKRKKAIQKK